MNKKTLLMNKKTILIIGALALGFYLHPNFARAATVTWDGGGDGRYWNNATNWSNDRVPGVTDSVILPAASATNVIYRGTQPSVRSLLNSGTLRINGSGAGSHAALTVSGSLTNAGTILLESSDGGYNDTLTVGGTLVNVTNGVIQVNEGSGGGRYLYASVVNRGAVNVASGTELYCYTKTIAPASLLGA